MTDQSSMAKQRSNLTGASPASPFAARVATIRHSRHGQHRIKAPTLALVFTIRKRNVVPASLLKSCSSVRRVVERNEIYTLVCGKTFLVVAHTFLPPTYRNSFVLLLGQACPVSRCATAGHME
jgi:hypothetical protein